MSKYSITATKKDYQFAFDELLKLEKQLKENLDWKRIKRARLDELVTLIGILKRRLPAPTQPQHTQGELKYKMFKDTNLSISCVIHSSNGDTICVMKRDDAPDYNVQEANAQRIVKAVNMHDELVDGIKKAIKDLQRPHSDGSIALGYLEQLIKQAE